MQFDFDTIIDRTNSDSVKLERLKSYFGRDDLIPLWVADMDFKSPPAVICDLARTARLTQCRISVLRYRYGY